MTRRSTVDFDVVKCDYSISFSMSIDDHNHNHNQKDDDNDEWHTDVVFSPQSQLCLYIPMRTYHSLLTGRKRENEREREKNWQELTLVNSICSLVSICSWEKNWTKKDDRWIHISPAPCSSTFLSRSRSPSIQILSIVNEEDNSREDSPRGRYSRVSCRERSNFVFLSLSLCLVRSFVQSRVAAQLVKCFHRLFLFN